MTLTVQAADTRPEDRPRAGAPRWAVLLAAVLGVLGALLAVATPLLPVTQTSATISWPQQGSLQSITAPLVSYAPQKLDVTVPCSMATAAPAGGQDLLTTVPSAAPGSAQLGLTVQTKDGSLTVLSRGQRLLSTPLNQLSGSDCAVRISSTVDETTVRVGEVTRTFTTDLRPQLVGIFTEAQGTPPAGLSATAEVDTSYSTSPTPLKLALMLVGAACAIGALAALYRMERVDGRRHVRALPARWWVLGRRDAAVFGVLGVWYVIGANTSDDGYLLTMARAARESGYMGNYYRWFDVPEAPFGWTYELISLMTHVSTASPWIRLPSLVVALVCWLLISREVLPRLGRRVRSSKAAAWTAAGVLLLFWLPYNNGLRPEPVIAMGTLLTWCSVERAIATKRLLPAAVALLVAGLSLAAGPTGLISVAVLLAAVRPLYHLLRSKIRDFGVLPVLAPLVAMGLSVLYVVFADQTLRSVLDSTEIRTTHGGSRHWNDEIERYVMLMNNFSADGALARRLPVLLMLLSLVAIFVVMMRRGRVPGAALGPSQRLLGAGALSLAIISLTPTKWTHHFGAFAALGACIAALAVVAVQAPARHRRRNFGVFLSVLLVALALAATGSNNWWYTASFGITWFDQPGAIAGYPLSSILLGLAVLAALFAVWEHLRGGPPAARAGQLRARVTGMAPGTLAVICWVVVICEVLVFAKAMVQRWPAYTVGKSNLQAISGDTCALANDVLVERNPSASVLPPVAGGSAASALGGETNSGFTVGGVPVSEDPVAMPGQRTTRSAEITGFDANTPAPLPFALGPDVPVLGSYAPGTQDDASLTSSWYRLPARSADHPLLVLTAAGTTTASGTSLVVEYGRSSGGTVQQTGAYLPLDPGPSPSWRNLRVPLADLPGDVDSVRVRAVVSTLQPGAWVAVTPPRVPEMQTLNTVVGSTQPVLLDWVVPLAFPCQRPFAVVNGIAEVPTYRISPAQGLALDASLWQDATGGGPLGWLELVAVPRDLGTYLADDWARDWGALTELVPLRSATQPAEIANSTKTVGGLGSSKPR